MSSETSLSHIGSREDRVDFGVKLSRQRRRLSRPPTYTAPTLSCLSREVNRDREARARSVEGLYISTCYSNTEESHNDATLSRLQMCVHSSVTALRHPLVLRDNAMLPLPVASDRSSTPYLQLVNVHDVLGRRNLGLGQPRIDLGLELRVGDDVLVLQTVCCQLRCLGERVQRLTAGC
jgi:hypothetical protein